MDDKLSHWLSEEIENRGWSIRETARKAGISHTPIANILTEQTKPGLDVLTALADALDTPREEVFRIAGILPSLPPETEETREATSLFARLDTALRHSMLVTMRNLLGLSARSTSVRENTVNYQAAPAPLTETERLAKELAAELEMMTEEEQELVFSVMERLRGIRKRRDRVATD